MPKAARRTSSPNVAANRKESYTKTSPKSTSKTDKESFDSKTSSKSKALPKSDKSTNKGDYRDIHLDEVKGEVPCYDNAATIRRKLKKLLEDKSTITAPARNGAKHPWQPRCKS